MAIPDYQSLMLPFLKILGDGQEHTIDELTETLAQQVGLTPEERSEILPSGTQTRFVNRVSWVRTYLKKALLVESTGRARVRITDRGLQILRQNPPHIDVRFLRQFPEFLEFQSAPRHLKEGLENDAESSGHEILLDPREILESSYQNLRRDLARELLDLVKSCSPRFFEHLVVDLLVAMGYGGSRKDAGQAIGQVGDGGIDGIIKEDKLGLDVVYIQAKRWEGTVGRPVVQGFAGSLAGQKARKGVLITTSQFSPEAREYVSKIDMKIVLIDGDTLAQLMIDHGVGVTEIASYTVKKVDLDYFDQS